LWWCWRSRREIKIVEDRNIIVEVEEQNKIVKVKGK